jgi:hypothetical protein
MSNSAQFSNQLEGILTRIDEPLKIRVRVRNGREIFSVSSPSENVLLREAANLLAERVQSEIPTNLLGYLKGRGEQQAFNIVYKKYNEGKFIATADIYKFFPSVCLKRMAGILRKNGIDRRIIISSYLADRRLNYAKGLVTGIPTSPILASLYLKPIVDKLNFEGWEFIFYADNFFGFAESKAAAEELLLSLKLALGEHSYYKRCLKLNTGLGKGPRIYSPFSTIELLGSVIRKDGILPNPKNSALYYSQKIKSLKGAKNG